MSTVIQKVPFEVYARERWINQHEVPRREKCFASRVDGGAMTSMLKFQIKVPR